ncbi:MAG TPA: phosphate acetyltransferase [Propionibacteriaceae bacterium]|nr:phosphate acetyltransferase [Propionibacteriaceae bacterium]
MSTQSVYIAASEGKIGKSAIALGLVEALARQVSSIGVFRPLVRDTSDDEITRALLAQPPIDQDFASAMGVSYEEFARDENEALGTIISRFGELRQKYDAIVVIGSDFPDGPTPTEMTFNAVVAANLNAPVIGVVSGAGRDPQGVRRNAKSALDDFRQHHSDVVAIIATKCDPELRDEVAAELATIDESLVTAALPSSEVLAAPTIRAQFKSADVSLWYGNEEWLDRESLGVLVAGMTLPHLLERLENETTLVVPADRIDLLPGLLLANDAGTFPNIAAIVLVGDYPVPETIQRLMRGVHIDIPIGQTDNGTFTTATRLYGMTGTSTSSPRKVEVARRLFNDHVDTDALMTRLNVQRGEIRTPRMFEYQLMQEARRQVRTIVMPEASDDRILESASIILQRGVARIILLGDENRVLMRAHELGFDISGADVVDPDDPELVEKFAAEFARLRAKKGITIEQARERMKDLSTFATMMVHFGMADGMVSGAVNTTANTIRPSLEFIKTKPGVTVVSSSFLMCMPDEVVVYGDCAVNPDPNAEQLADIAISSAETAERFGIEPRVAMLSYSTGTSGSGADVDKVRQATEIVKERRPDLMVEGPIQFDAAVDPVVGQKKMPGSRVAGHATVLIFPDLNTGNNTYKAVQRTSGAVAIGPVLQGLNKPVNDLSRGALVDDIVNTVAITAIQAQQESSPSA